MKIETLRSFDDDFRRLPREMQERARRLLGVLIDNPRHPSLRFKKMGGSETWELRVSRGYRITLEMREETYLLRRIGSHDILRSP